MTETPMPEDCARQAPEFERVWRSTEPSVKATGRETELRALVAPVAEELELSSGLLERELDSESAAVGEVISLARRYRGKRLRAAVLLLTAKALQGIDAGKGGKASRVSGVGVSGVVVKPMEGLSDAHIQIAAIVEMIHMATLVHDDVLDHAEVRRRVPTVNARYGNQNAVLLGDWIYARAFCISTKLDDQTCSRRLAEVTATLCQGEIEQSRAKYDFEMGVDKYLRIIDAKTASLYAASCELGARYAGAGEGLVARAHEFGRNLGFAFQIVDDCLDFEGAEDVVGKSLGTDVAEGKITLPMIFALKGLTAPRRRRFEEIFRDGAEANLTVGARNGAEPAYSVLRAEFDMSRAVAESYVEAKRFIGLAIRALEAFPTTSARACLETMAKYVLGRRW